MVRHVISALLPLILVSCGSDKLGRSKEVLPPIVPASQETPREPLQQLAGYYDLVELDGERGLSGYVGIIFDEKVAGVLVSPLLSAENPAPRVEWLIPSANSKVEYRDTQILLSYSAQEETLEVLFDRSDKELNFSGRRCRDGDCISLRCLARKPE